MLVENCADSEGMVSPPEPVARVHPSKATWLTRSHCRVSLHEKYSPIELGSLHSIRYLHRHREQGGVHRSVAEGGSIGGGWSLVAQKGESARQKRARRE